MVMTTMIMVTMNIDVREPVIVFIDCRLIMIGSFDDVIQILT
jgi:hypothetical protein